MKAILPWIVAVLALGGAVYFFKDSQAKSAQVVKLQADVQQLETTRAEFEKLKETQVAPEELVRLRKNTEDLIRLRGEVGRLKNENEQAAKATQAAQGQIQQLQGQALAAQQQVQTLATNMQNLSAQSQALTQQIATRNLNACINQMRQIDSAIQQWALETGKRDSDAPDPAAIALYIKGNILPTCPQGGAYKLAATVGATPVVTCSIPGHALGTSQ